MRESSRTEDVTTTTAERGRRFPRRLFRGYATHAVDDTVEQLQASVAKLPRARPAVQSGLNVGARADRPSRVASTARSHARFTAGLVATTIRFGPS